MIRQECVDELAQLAGVSDEVKAVTLAAMRGEIPFEESLIRRVALLQGLTESSIAAVMAKVDYAAGGRTLLATLRANGCYTVLISGGFTAFTAGVAAALGFDEHRRQPARHRRRQACRHGAATDSRQRCQACGPR